MALTNQYPSLTDKVVFIFGGAQEIGAALVEAFCRQHCRVAFADHDEAAGHALVDRLVDTDPALRPVFYSCAPHEIPALQDVIASVGRELGDISVLVNNTVGDIRHDFRQVTESYWNDQIDVSIRHSFFAIQAVHEQMKRLGGGSVVNVGTVSWQQRGEGMTGYIASKAGMEGVTRGLARDLGQDNIRINTIVPGKTSKDRILTPEDICSMALFLSADDSRMCTAQNFIVANA